MEASAEAGNIQQPRDRRIAHWKPLQRLAIYSVGGQADIFDKTYRVPTFSFVLPPPPTVRTHMFAAKQRYASTVGGERGEEARSLLWSERGAPKKKKAKEMANQEAAMNAVPMEITNHLENMYVGTAC